MSEITTDQTFTLEAVAIHLDLDYTAFVTRWLPKYRQFLSESGQGDPPTLTMVDLALFEQVREFRNSGHPHQKIKGVLTDLRKPEVSRKVSSLITGFEAQRHTA